MQNHKAFTLIEVIIVTLILGLLAGLLLNTYVTMTKIAFRVQQEKSMTEQIVYVMQVIQNLAEKNTIDYVRYEEEF
jgi:prepilin-type N-terminal cleavage/methylation domain-containing protein